MDPNNPYETWQAVIEKVKSYGTVNPAQVDAFLGRMQPQASSVGFLLATVDTDFIKGQIEKRFLSQIEQALRDLFETEYVVEIEVDPGSSAFMQQIATQNAQQAAPYTPPAQPQPLRRRECRRVPHPSRPHIPNLQRQPRSRFNHSLRPHRKFSLLPRHSRAHRSRRRRQATSPAAKSRGRTAWTRAPPR